jgi:hypothetical protein
MNAARKEKRNVGHHPSTSSSRNQSGFTASQPRTSTDRLFGHRAAPCGAVRTAHLLGRRAWPLLFEAAGQVDVPASGRAARVDALEVAGGLRSDAIADPRIMRVAGRHGRRVRTRAARRTGRRVAQAPGSGRRAMTGQKELVIHHFYPAYAGDWVAVYLRGTVARPYYTMPVAG